MKSFRRGPFTVLEKSCPPCSTAVLAVFRSRWGEVDGYLPVLYKIKERHPDWRLIALLMSSDLVRQAEEQPFLYHQLREVADILILPQLAPSIWQRRIQAFMARLPGLRWASLIKYMTEQPIRIVLKDHAEQDRFLTQLDRRLHPRWVIYPHGTGLYIEPPSAVGRSFRETRADLVLVGHQPEVACFERMLGRAAGRSFCAFGHPRYDPWWIQRLAQAEEFRASEEVRRAANFKRTFLFATRGPNDKLLPLPTFQELCRAVAETVLKDPSHLLLIKPHPKQDLALLESQFSSYDPKRWMISSFQTTQLAGLADFVICMISGVILDALAARKPTVEFFRYGPSSESFFRDESGRTVSAYVELGLVPAAQSADELAALINEYFQNGPRSERWEEQRRTVDAFMRLDNQTSDRVVSAIDNLVQPSQSSLIQK